MAHGEQQVFDGAAFLEAFMSQLRAALATTKLGVAIKGAEVRPVKASLAGKQLSASNGRLMGFSLRETSGATTATVYLRDGNDATGDIIAAIQLGASESTRDTYMPGGLSFVNGLFYDLAAGSVEGSVWINGTAD